MRRVVDAGLPGVPKDDYRVAMFDFDAVANAASDGRSTVLLRAEDGRAVLATLGNGGAVTSVAVVPRDDVRRTFADVRFMAAYAFLSEALASDALPREVCAHFIDTQTELVPALTARLVAAAKTPPAQDAKTVEAARAAYAAFARRHGGWPFSDDPTAQTLAALGPTTSATVVYRDADDRAFGVGSDVDVVRFGDDAKHAYGLVLVAPNGRAEIATSDLCLAGDVRCTAERSP